MQVKSEHIKRWMTEHESSLADITVSVSFERHLNTLPWAPSHLDWRSIEHVRFEMSEAWEARILGFAERTSMAKHSHLLFLYSAAEPSLVCLKEDGLLDIDLIYYGAPGARYFCGVDLIDGVPTPAFNHLAEFDGFSIVRFPLYGEESRTDENDITLSRLGLGDPFDVMFGP